MTTNPEIFVNNIPTSTYTNQSTSYPVMYDTTNNQLWYFDNNSGLSMGIFQTGLMTTNTLTKNDYEDFQEMLRDWKQKKYPELFI
jgi:hypothetical protein